MDRFVSLVKWILRMWPVLLPLVFGAIHVFANSQLEANWSVINKQVSLVFQFIGGLLILYSIDSNLGIANNTSLFNELLNFLKSFPLIKRHYTLVVDSATSTSTAHPAKIRVNGPKNTIEEKIEHLEKKIEWLQEDLNDEVKALKESITRSGLRTTQTVSKLQDRLGVIDSKVKAISTGGIKAQIFGVLLMLHGSLAGYYA